MRKGFLGYFTALVVGAGLASAQAPDRAASAPATPESLPPAVKGDKTEKPTSGKPATDRPTADKAADKADTGPGPAPRPVDATAAPAAPTGVALPADGEDGARGDRCWVDLEYILWRTKKMNLPPLVTTGPPSSQGILGQPGTVILFGDGAPLDEEMRSGFRVSGGMYLDCEKCWNLDYSFFYIPQRNEEHVFNGNLCGLLARPFFSLNLCQEFSEITSLPGLALGTTTVQTPFRFGGAEADITRKVCCGCCYRVDLLGGFRYLYMDEAVQIDEFIRVNNVLPPNFQQFQPFAGDTIQVSDRFRTRNQFYGGQVGLEGVFAHGPLQLQVRGKVALGDTHEIIDISGSQTVTTPTGQVTHFVGGLLALPSNIGHFNRDEFSVVPEVTVNLGYRLSHCLTVYAGYNFLYWSRVARAGDQIDRVIDTSQIPNFGSNVPTGVGRPAVPFAQNDFWAQGLNVGLEINW